MKTNTHQYVLLCYVKFNPSYHAENTITVCLLILFFSYFNQDARPRDIMERIVPYLVLGTVKKVVVTL